MRERDLGAVARAGDLEHQLVPFHSSCGSTKVSAASVTCQTRRLFGTASSSRCVDQCIAWYALQAEIACCHATNAGPSARS
jgi:hypothetical protein